MAGYIGTQPVPQATQTRDAFTATAGQTSFTTSGYTPGFLDVYLNGVKLAAADYTATNSTDVVLTVGAAVNDILEVVAYTTFEVLDPTFGEVNLNKINDANGDEALTITSNSTVQVHNEIEFIGNTGLNAHIQKNASAGRDELQIYSATDANGSGSRGAGMHLYGNSDNEHSGNVAFITGPDDGGEGRMFVSGWDTNTHVTIGNGPTGETIWEFVDNQKDKALLNLINPTGGPALFFMEANGTTEGDITVNDGESLQFGHWNYTTSTYTNRMAMTPTGFDVLGQLTIEDTGDVKVAIKTTGTGDADATLVLDSADTGESVLQFEHDGVYGAKVEWFTDGEPDLNIATVGATSVIDMQPNGVRTGRFDTSGLEVTGTVTATSFAGDGSALTGVGGSTTAGAVGTYAFLWRDNAGTTLGTTHAGSTLFYAIINDDNTSGAVANVYHGNGTVRSGISPSGTWRAMGSAGSYSAAYGQATVYVRIS